MTPFSRFIVWGNALFFILYGLAFLLMPGQLADWITDATPGSASALMDMRATYGGMTIAVGVLFALLGTREATHAMALQAIALVLLLMATGRALGMAMDGAANIYMWLYLVGELLVGGVALVLSRSPAATA